MDSLLTVSAPVDREHYPFEHEGRYWTSEERCKELGQLWPAIDKHGDSYLEKVKEWMDHLTTYSVTELDAPIPEELLEMIDCEKKKEGRRVDFHPGTIDLWAR